MQPKIEPCPFCGNKASLSRGPYKEAFYSIGCDNIDCSMKPCTDWHTTRARAITSWSTRADSSTKKITEAAEFAIAILGGCYYSNKPALIAATAIKILKEALYE